MSSLAVVGLRYDNVDLQDWSAGFFLKIRSGLYDGVTVRGKDITIPYSDGQEPRARRAHARKIVLEGVIFAGNDILDPTDRHTAYRVNARALEDLFAPWRMPATLIATFDNAESSSIEARPLNIVPKIDLEEEIATVSIELESVVPHWTANARVGSAAISIVTATSATGGSHTGEGAASASVATSTSASGTNP